MKELNNQEDIRKRINLLIKQQEKNIKEKNNILKPIDKKITKTDDEISQLKLRLQSICKHTNTSVEVLFIEGNYYNKSYTEHTEICDLCEKIINTWFDKEGGSYG